MRAVLIGAVESTATTFEALVEGGHPPIAVVSLEHSLARRHSDFVDLEPLARSVDAQYIPVRSVNAPEIVARISALQPEWILVVGWSQIVHEPLLRAARMGAIGYHPSPLPELRGRAVLAWTILLQREWTAGTLFRLEPTVDSGEILAQHRFSLDPRESLPTLMAKHMAALRSMWRDLLPRLADGTATGVAQDPGRASYCAKRTAADGLIDWTQDAVAVDRLVRAVAAPYPSAFTFRGEERLMIHEAEPWSGPRYFGLPGQILDIRDEAILVACCLGQALLVRRWAWTGSDDAPRPLRIGERLGGRG